MKIRSFTSVCLLALAAFVGGCSDSDEDLLAVHAEAAVQAPKLNLSHIECAEEPGKVLVHFVLLFAGDGQPGALTGTYSGGTFGPVSSNKHSGNVWHYDAFLPVGFIEITGAKTTTSTGAVVTLKNPGEYSGYYQDVCGPAVEECPVKVEPVSLYCTPNPLGNEGAECAEFGLLPQGKDDQLSGLSFVATQSAYVAIVKSGTRGCAHGDQAYRIYVDVTEGQTLLTPVDQNISHVTYCACPPN